MTNTTTRIFFADAIDRLLDDDDSHFALRSLLIDPDDDLTNIYTERAAAIERPRILALIDAMTPDDRALLRLALSLCPLHHCDYAICFDDDLPDCSMIRTCFPTHDT